MDCLRSMNNALEYIEEHLTEEIEDVYKRQRECRARRKEATNC